MGLHQQSTHIWFIEGKVKEKERNLQNNSNVHLSVFRSCFSSCFSWHVLAMLVLLDFQTSEFCLQYLWGGDRFWLVSVCGTYVCVSIYIKGVNSVWPLISDVSVMAEDLTCFLRASNAALMVWTRVLSRALASSLLVCWMALTSWICPGPSSVSPTRFLGDSWVQTRELIRTGSTL